MYLFFETTLSDHFRSFFRAPRVRDNPDKTKTARNSLADNGFYAFVTCTWNTKLRDVPKDLTVTFANYQLIRIFDQFTVFDESILESRNNINLLHNSLSSCSPVPFCVSSFIELYNDHIRFTRLLNERFSKVNTSGDYPTEEFSFRLTVVFRMTWKSIYSAQRFAVRSLVIR